MMPPPDGVLYAGSKMPRDRRGKLNIGHENA
jgi:hypothetical protein